MRLLFEIGMEELPARFSKQALKDLKTNLENKLKDGERQILKRLKHMEHQED